MMGLGAHTHFFKIKDLQLPSLQPIGPPEGWSNTIGNVYLGSKDSKKWKKPFIWMTDPLGRKIDKPYFTPILNH